MKPTFETAKHQAIFAQRMKDQASARLGEIVGNKAARILSNELTFTERFNRRDRAMQENPAAFHDAWKKHYKKNRLSY